MRKRESRVFARGDGRRHAGHNLEIDARRCQCRRLFAAAAENVRVAPFEPHDRLACLGGLDQSAIDFILTADLAGLRFDAARALRFGRREAQQERIGKSIVEHQVGSLQAPQAFHGQKPRISRSGADEVNLAVGRHTGSLTSIRSYPSRR